MAKYNFNYETPQVVTFVVTIEGDDPVEAETRAREVLRAEATEDRLGNFDIEFADWFLSLRIDGEAPITFLGPPQLDEV